MNVLVQKARCPNDPVFVVIIGGGNYVDDTVAE